MIFSRRRSQQYLVTAYSALCPVLSTADNADVAILAHLKKHANSEPYRHLENQGDTSTFVKRMSRHCSSLSYRVTSYRTGGGYIMAKRFSKTVDLLNSLAKSRVLGSDDDIFLKKTLKEIEHSLSVKDFRKSEALINSFCERILRKLYDSTLGFLYKNRRKLGFL